MFAKGMHKTTHHPTHPTTTTPSTLVAFPSQVANASRWPGDGSERDPDLTDGFRLCNLASSLLLGYLTLLAPGALLTRGNLNHMGRLSQTSGAHGQRVIHSECGVGTRVSTESSGEEAKGKEVSEPEKCTTEAFQMCLSSISRGAHAVV